MDDDDNLWEDEDGVEPSSPIALASPSPSPSPSDTDQAAEVLVDFAVEPVVEEQKIDEQHGEGQGSLIDLSVKEEVGRGKGGGSSSAHWEEGRERGGGWL